MPLSLEDVLLAVYQQVLVENRGGGIAGGEELSGSGDGETKAQAGGFSPEKVIGE